jgi:predicted nucleic acid-binding Zn ribbon protein
LKNNKVNNDAREKNNMQLFILVGVLLLVVGGYSALKLL